MAKRKAPAKTVKPAKTYKEELADLNRKLDQQYGPQAINGAVTVQQAKAVIEILEAGQPLYGRYSRWNEEEIRAMAGQVAERAASIIGDKLTPPLRQRLIDQCLAFGLGIMSGAAWDLLKTHIPHLRNLFMAAEPTENMKEIARWEAAAQAKAPSGLRDFADKNTVALSALRAQTWRRLQDSIEETELASVLDEALIKDLMEAYENMLFARGHV